MTNPPLESAVAQWKGIGVGIVSPFIALFFLTGIELAARSSAVALFNTAFFSLSGFVKWLWIVPMMKKARAEGRVKYARGLKMGAWIVFVPYVIVFGVFGVTWILLHLNLDMGFPWFYTHDP